MPPPPPPPPPPMGGPPPAAAPVPTIDRSALLSQIRTGTHLKRAETNDRSAPSVAGSSGGRPSGSGGRGSAVGGSAQAGHPPAPISNGPMGLGGLFAQGMPKLKPTGNRSGDWSVRSQSSSDRNTSSSPALTRFQPPAFSSHNGPVPGSPNPRQGGPANRSHYAPGGIKKSFPSDLNPRGPPPMPPSASQKPALMGVNGVKPAPPSKPPGVSRSSSQTSLNSKSYRNGSTVSNVQNRTPAPTSKPPPPPKSGGPPALPSQPPNLSRRKSFGGQDVQNGGPGYRLNASHLQNQSGYGKSNVPPPPPRNTSVPNGLNDMHTLGGGGGGSHPNLPAAPGIPPAPPPQSAKANLLLVTNNDMGRSMPNLGPGNTSQVGRTASVRAPAPPPPPPNRVLGAPPPPPSSAPPPPPPPTSAPPPPPSHLHGRMGSIKSAAPPPPPPPHQVNRLSSGQPPPPPARNISHSFSEDAFESRFAFCKISELPNPSKMQFLQKNYTNKASRPQNKLRNPPPPPPPFGQNTHLQQQRQVHIKFDSTMFANSSSQC